MKNLILILSALMISSCTFTSVNNKPAVSNEVSRLNDHHDYDTLVTLTAKDTMFIIENGNVVKSIPLVRDEKDRVIVGITFFITAIIIMFLISFFN